MRVAGGVHSPRYLLLTVLHIFSIEFFVCVVLTGEMKMIVRMNKTITLLVVLERTYKIKKSTSIVKKILQMSRCTSLLDPHMYAYFWGNICKVV